MKKFLLSAIISTLILLMSAVAFAADMPDFRQLDSSITLDDDAEGEELDDLETGCRTYVYRAPIGREANLAAQYAN